MLTSPMRSSPDRARFPRRKGKDGKLRNSSVRLAVEARRDEVRAGIAQDNQISFPCSRGRSIPSCSLGQRLCRPSLRSGLRVTDTPLDGLPRASGRGISVPPYGRVRSRLRRESNEGYPGIGRAEVWASRTLDGVGRREWRRFETRTEDFESRKDCVERRTIGHPAVCWRGHHVLLHEGRLAWWEPERLNWPMFRYWRGFPVVVRKPKGSLRT